MARLRTGAKTRSALAAPVKYQVDHWTRDVNGGRVAYRHQSGVPPLVAASVALARPLTKLQWAEDLRRSLGTR